MVGAGVMSGGWVSVRNGKVRAKLRETYPDEPWRWNAAWNFSPIPESGWSAGKMMFPVAAWWVLITGPLLAAGMIDGVFARAERWWMLLPGVFFVAVVWAVLHQLRERGRIGGMWVDLALPLRPGREITGAWITGKPLHSHDSPVLNIVCRRSVTTRSNGKTRMHTEIIWEREESLSVIDQTREVSAFRLPFRFELPVDVEETTFEDASTAYIWKLEFRVPGTPVKSTFEVPVVRDPNGPNVEPLAETVRDKASDAEVRLPELLKKAKVEAVFDANGNLMSLVCGPRRWLGSIIFLGIFNLIWTAVSVFLWYSDAPMIFKVVWPLSSAGIWLLIIYQMVSSRELRLERGEAHVVRRILIYQSKSVVPVDSVTGVLHDTNSNVNGMPYYRVKLETAMGQRITVASGLAGESAALGLVRQLERWRNGMGR